MAKTYGNKSDLAKEVKTAIFGNEVKVLMGKSVVDFGEGDRLKSDIALATNLPAYTINEIVDKTRKKLSKRKQPIAPYDIATTAHFVMVEIGLKTEGDAYMQYIINRRDSALVPKEKIKFIKCEYCGTTSDPEYKFCPSCGRTLNKSDIKTKII